MTFKEHMLVKGESMWEKNLWNAEKTLLLAQTPEQAALEEAVRAYFKQSQLLREQEEQSPLRVEMQQALQRSLDTIKDCLHADIKEFSYKVMLVLQVCNEDFDAENADLAKACAAQGQPYVCSESCVGCCHQMVLCTLFEGWLLDAFLRENAAAKAHFLAQWEPWYERSKPINESYLRWGRAYYGEGKDDKSHSREDYYIPCPFLDAAGQCVVYAVRPYACRSAVAVDKRCSQGDDKGFKGMHSLLAALYTGHDAARGKIFTTFLTEDCHLQKDIMPLMVKKHLERL